MTFLCTVVWYHFSTKTKIESGRSIMKNGGTLLKREAINDNIGPAVNDRISQLFFKYI